MSLSYMSLLSSSEFLLMLYFSNYNECSDKHNDDDVRDNEYYYHRHNNKKVMRSMTYLPRGATVPHHANKFRHHY